MAKKIMQDIFMGKGGKQPTSAVRGNSADIIQNPDSEKIRKIPPLRQPEKKSHQPFAFSEQERSRINLFRHSRFDWIKKPLFWQGLGGAVLVFLAMLVLGALFSKTTIEVLPEKATVPVNIPLVSKKGALDGIPFEIVLVKGSETKNIAATGTKRTERKASGKIVIYNNYSGVAQKLIKNTRFESLDGKIYRTGNSVTVPGVYSKNRENIPGSVEVTVFADKVGSEYNSPLTDFTIPGFKGDPRYSKFYARSKTEMTEGFIGDTPVASEEDLALAKSAIEDSLKEDLFHEASSQIPNGYILYKNAIQISFDGIKDASNSPNSLTVEENGTLVGILLKKDALSSEVIKNIASQDKNDIPFTLDSLETLSFSFGNGTTILDDKTKELPFTLTGNADITYIVDKNSLINDLVGKARRELPVVLIRYPAVSEVTIVSIRPFWARYFPNNPSKIEIKVSKE